MPLIAMLADTTANAWGELSPIVMPSWFAILRGSLSTPASGNQSGANTNMIAVSPSGNIFILMQCANATHPVLINNLGAFITEQTISGTPTPNSAGALCTADNLGNYYYFNDFSKMLVKLDSTLAVVWALDYPASIAASYSQFYCDSANNLIWSPASVIILSISPTGAINYQRSYTDPLTTVSGGVLSRPDSAGNTYQGWSISLSPKSGLIQRNNLGVVLKSISFISASLSNYATCVVSASVVWSVWQDAAASLPSYSIYKVNVSTNTVLNQAITTNTLTLGVTLSQFTPNSAISDASGNLYVSCNSLEPSGLITTILTKYSSSGVQQWCNGITSNPFIAGEWWVDAGLSFSQNGQLLVAFTASSNNAGAIGANAIYVLELPTNGKKLGTYTTSTGYSVTYASYANMSTSAQTPNTVTVLTAGTNYVDAVDTTFAFTVNATYASITSGFTVTSTVATF